MTKIRQPTQLPFLIQSSLPSFSYLAHSISLPSGLAARALMAGGSKASAPGGKWIKGGFQQKMDKKEAAQILGLRLVSLLPCLSWYHQSTRIEDLIKLGRERERERQSTTEREQKDFSHLHRFSSCDAISHLERSGCRIKMLSSALFSRVEKEQKKGCLRNTNQSALQKLCDSLFCCFSKSFPDPFSFCSQSASRSPF